jgi:hypothetical protein
LSNPAIRVITIGQDYSVFRNTNSRQADVKEIANFNLTDHGYIDFDFLLRSHALFPDYRQSQRGAVEGKESAVVGLAAFGCWW